MGSAYSVRDSTSRSYVRGESTRRERADAVAFGTGVTDYSVWVELSFACTNLLNKDILSLSDPFAVLYLDSSDGWQEEGRTEIIPNDLNPKFVRSFQVLYEFERVQKFRVMVYDADEDRDVEDLVLEDQDFLGRAEFRMTDLITDREGKQELQLMDHDDSPMSESKILVYYEEQSSQSDEIRLKLSAVLPKQKSARCFYRISKQLKDNSWLPVYRSEAVQPPGNEPEYEWTALQTRLRGLCNADETRPLLLEFLAFRSRGAHQLAGKTVFSLKEVATNVDSEPSCSESAPWKRPLDPVELFLDKEETPAGMLFIKEYVRTPAPSFLEYIASGFEICFLVAIDFTKSNGAPEYPGSLHHILTDTQDSPRQLTVYEEAIHGVGRVLEAYDSDQLFPTWGFGAKLPGEANVVSHCFAVNGNDAAPECHGVKGILEAYRAALKRVTLAGPTFFSPVLKAAATLAAKDMDRKYYCLLMITDGVLLDMPRVKREIIAASSLPLSIMLVGVGTDDFTRMVELDSDDALLSEDGVQAERDIVQFVEFEKYKNNGEELAEELLAEFPGQFLSYMKKHDILPKRPDAAESHSNTRTSDTEIRTRDPEVGESDVTPAAATSEQG